MDRRNGGDPLAPPRPPKLLPKVHRPRAPEPEMMSATSQTTSILPVATATVTASAATLADRTTTTAANTPQCTNQSELSRNNNLNQPQHLTRSINNTTSSSFWTSQAPTPTLTIPAAAANSTAVPTVGNNTRYNRVSCNNNHIGNIDVVTQQPTNFDDYQIHHLTFLPQRNYSNLSRNSSHVSSSSSSSSVAVTNSFTRRRPPPPTPGGAGSAVPLLTISGNSNNNNNNNNFLNHFHSAEPVPTSPVTLAQPRPESERLSNEYVDTPLRTAQQLQNATRMQHPAGQHDNGQTTTHHLLLLPQRELRQQQQQQSQSHQHFHRLAGTAGSANATMGIDGTDGLLHSQHHPQHHIHNHQTHGPQQVHLHHQLHNPKATTKIESVTEKLSPKPETRGFLSSGKQPINQPITKQPALTNTDNPSKSAKELPALEELLDIHSIATGISTPPGMVSTVNGASPLGTPIVIGSSDAPSSLNPITCPRCDRCRCEQCQSPRPLPQTWVCNKTCLCSAESIIDYASCLCCAKALFYHCARDNDMDCDDSSGTPCVDNPCSCGPYKRTQRWGWLGALSLVLPCLWCYWPMRGCVALCEKCYGKFAKRGCRCQQIGSTSSMFPITSAANGANIVVLSNGSGLQSTTNGTSKSSSSATSGAHHHIHHNDCSTASRIIRKGDFTPEKRLLDSSPEY